MKRESFLIDPEGRSMQPGPAVGQLITDWCALRKELRQVNNILHHTGNRYHCQHHRSDNDNHIQFIHNIFRIIATSDNRAVNYTVNSIEEWLKTVIITAQNRLQKIRINLNTFIFSIFIISFSL
jgi:hypothetical protein